MSATVSPIRTAPAAATAGVVMVEIRDQFGNKAVHPVGDVAKAFASIAGTKTLTAHTLAQIEALGYRIMIESGGGDRGYQFLRSFIGR